MFVNSFFMPLDQHERFLDYLELEKKNSVHTITAYKADLLAFSQFIADIYGQEDLREVNYSQVRSWIVKLVEDGLSNNSINRKTSSLKTFYRFLQRQSNLRYLP